MKFNLLDYKNVKELSKELSCTEEELNTVVRKVDDYMRVKLSTVKKMHDGWFMVELLTCYAMLSTKERRILEELIVKHHIVPTYLFFNVVYKNSLDLVITDPMIFGIGEIKFMFNMLEEFIKEKMPGFISKNLKSLIRDTITRTNGTIHEKAMKDFIIQKHGKEARKIIMEVSLKGEI